MGYPLAWNLRFPRITPYTFFLPRHLPSLPHLEPCSDCVIWLTGRGPSSESRILKGKPTYMIYPSLVRRDYRLPGNDQLDR